MTFISGGILASHHFAALALSDKEGDPGAPAIISELVPFLPGAARVKIRRGSVTLDARNASATHPPCKSPPCR